MFKASLGYGRPVEKKKKKNRSPRRTTGLRKISTMEKWGGEGWGGGAGMHSVKY